MFCVKLYVHSLVDKLSRFSNICHINFFKFRPVGTVLFNADRLTDFGADMTKLTVFFFCNFMNGP